MTSLPVINKMISSVQGEWCRLEVNDLGIRDKNASEFGDTDAFNEAKEKGLENYVPLKLVKENKNSKPWFGKQCTDALQIRNSSHLLLTSMQ